MNKETFGTHLRMAAEFCWRFSQQYLVSPTPPDLLFHFWVAQLPPDGKGTIKYHGGRLLKPSQLVFLPVQRVGQLLWIDGRVPKWVNLNFMGSDATHSYIGIMSSPVLTADDDRLYYRETACPPFHILGPRLPAGRKKGERIAVTLEPWPDEIRAAAGESNTR